MCAITDHDIFDLDMYLALKQKEGFGTLKKVLPGVEFSVSFEEPGRKKRTVIHIVAIFDDRKPEALGSIGSIISDEKELPQYDDKENDAFSESRFTSILREIGLDVVLIGHEKSAGQEQSRDVSTSAWKRRTR